MAGPLNVADEALASLPLLDDEGQQRALGGRGSRRAWRLLHKPLATSLSAFQAFLEASSKSSCQAALAEGALPHHRNG